MSQLLYELRIIVANCLMRMIVKIHPDDLKALRSLCEGGDAAEKLLKEGGK